MFTWHGVLNTSNTYNSVMRSYTKNLFWFEICYIKRSTAGLYYFLMGMGKTKQRKLNLVCTFQRNWEAHLVGWNARVCDCKRSSSAHQHFFHRKRRILWIISPWKLTNWYSSRVNLCERRYWVSKRPLQQLNKGSSFRSNIQRMSFYSTLV